MSQIDGKDQAADWSTWPEQLPAIDDSFRNPELALVTEGEEDLEWQTLVPLHLHPSVAKALACANVWMQGKVGRASSRRLQASFVCILVWACTKYEAGSGTFDRFAAALFGARTYRPFVASVRYQNIRRELKDERERDAVVRDHTRLARFIDRWRARLVKETRTRASVWRIPEMSPEDSRETLLLELTEAMMEGGATVDSYARPGQEATYRFLAAEKDRLRAKRRVYVATPCVDLFPEGQCSPEALQLLAERERAIERLGPALLRIRPELTKPAAKWLSALLLESKWSDGPINLARVAANLGRNRSSAVRAIQAVREALERGGYANPFLE